MVAAPVGYVAPRATQGKLCWLSVLPTGSTGPRRGGGVHTLYLPLNPDLQVTRAIRTTPTQTIEGAWVDNFGLGIGTLTLSGHTGWASNGGRYNGQPVNGYDAYVALWYDIVEYYFALQSQQATTTPTVVMQFGNDPDGWFFDVMPTSSPQPFSVQRTKTKPLLYQYTLSLIVLRDNNHPGAVAPLADPIDPLIQVNPTAAVTHTVVGLGTPPGHGASPVQQQLPARTQTVQVTAGATLWSIAAQYLPPGASGAQIAAAVQAIATANQVANANLIYVGQKLTIPHPLP